jgi:hypothetical protein
VHRPARLWGSSGDPYHAARASFLGPEEKAMELITLGRLAYPVLLTDAKPRWVIRVSKCPECDWSWHGVCPGDRDDALALATDAIKRHFHSRHERSSAIRP